MSLIKGFRSGFELRAMIVRVTRIQDALAEEQKRHEVTMEKLRQDLRTAQESCPHPLTDYFPDPSGNNDSFDECQVCQARGKNL